MERETINQILDLLFGDGVKYISYDTIKKIAVLVAASNRQRGYHMENKIAEYAEAIIRMNVEFKKLSEKLTRDDEAHYESIMAKCRKMRGV